jgi:hypothetical protein
VFDRARALHYLSSMQKIAEVVCVYRPPQ